MTTSKNEKVVNGPPMTFNLIKDGFRPSDSFEINNELHDTIQNLYEQGKYRSALDRLFEVLDVEPDNEQALRLSMLILGASRSQRTQVAEPLSPSYMNVARTNVLFSA